MAKNSYKVKIQLAGYTDTAKCERLWFTYHQFLAQKS